MNSSDKKHLEQDPASGSDILAIPQANLTPLKKNVRKIGILALAVYLGLFLPRYASLITDAIIPFGNITWLYLHHLLQMSFALGVILLLSVLWKKPVREWGFNARDNRWSLRVVGKFCIGYLLFLTIGTLVNQIILGWPEIIWFPLTWQGLVENLLFSSMMPGISEEILFRAMVMGILGRAWEGHFTIGKEEKTVEISHANIIAAIIFALAHVHFTLWPFQILYMEPMQLAFALALGLFYGVMLDRTRSLLGPVLAHNASDGIAVVLYTLITIIFM